MLRPLSNKIVVQPLTVGDKTPGGIYLPDNAKEKPLQGTIVAAGPGRTTDRGKIIHMSVRVGDVVLFGKYSGTETEFNGETYVVMTEDDVLAVVSSAKGWKNHSDEEEVFTVETAQCVNGKPMKKRVSFTGMVAKF